MTGIVLTLLALLAQSKPLLDEGEGQPVEASYVEVAFDPAVATLRLPRSEKLVYEVHLDLAVVDSSVGTVTQTSTVEPYRRSVLMGGGGETEGLETATIQLRAVGGYSFYTMDATVEARHLPQGWPRSTFRQVSEGSKKRRHEVMLGWRDGEYISSYRRDTSKGAPDGTRIWKDPKVRGIPEGAADMLSAIFFARTLMRQEREELVFPLIEKNRLWEVRIRPGEERRLKTEAGTFDAVRIVLEPEPFEGEELEEEKIEDFQGLLGLEGSISMWVERESGIPVLVHGTLSFGPMDFGIDLVLESYEGTPPEFQPVGD